MKKSLLTVITFALVLINLVLTVINTIVFVPQVQNSNKLIEKICAAIDLDLESGSASSSGNVSPADRETIVISSENMTINLREGSDGKQHVVMLQVSIEINKKHDDYKELQPIISEKADAVKSEVNNVVSQYTYEEVAGNTSQIQEDILKQLQKYFQSDIIIGVSFPSITYQ